jgi:hypothetical protein
MHTCGGIHTRTCLGLGEYMVNSSMGNLTEVKCLKPGFQSRLCNFQSLGLGGGCML